jgi:hypothetical protein
MVLKNICAVALCAALLAWGGLSVADEYRPDEFLGLDLSSAVLSPRPLGPATQFAPVPIAARTDRASRAAAARAERVTQPATRAAHLRADKPRCGPNKSGAAARQSARCAGVRYPDSKLAVQVRRHLQLEVTGRRGSSAGHDQIAAQHYQQRQHHEHAHHAGDDREQLVGFKPSS